MFKLFDAGKLYRTPSAKPARDCQARALATARGISYVDAWALLYQLQGERRSCAFDLVGALEIEDSRLGPVRKLSFPAKLGRKRMTGAEFCRKHRTGAFVLRMAHHVVAVLDGTIHDTWDSSEKCVYTAWRVVNKNSAETS